MSHEVDAASGMEAIARSWNDPKKLDAFVAVWMIGWFLIFFLILKSFFFGLFPENLVGGVETGLVFAAGYSPVLVVAYRRRRILRSART